MGVQLVVGVVPHVPAGADRVAFQCDVAGVCWPCGVWAGSRWCWWQRLGRDVGL